MQICIGYGNVLNGTTRLICWRKVRDVAPVRGRGLQTSRVSNGAGDASGQELAEPALVGVRPRTLRGNHQQILLISLTTQEREHWGTRASGPRNRLRHTRVGRTSRKPDSPIPRSADAAGAVKSITAAAVVDSAVAAAAAVVDTDRLNMNVGYIRTEAAASIGNTMVAGSRFTVGDDLCRPAYHVQHAGPRFVLRCRPAYHVQHVAPRFVLRYHSNIRSRSGPRCRAGLRSPSLASVAPASPHWILGLEAAARA